MHFFIISSENENGFNNDHFHNDGLTRVNSTVVSHLFSLETKIRMPVQWHENSLLQAAQWKSPILKTNHYYWSQCLTLRKAFKHYLSIKFSFSFSFWNTVYWSIKHLKDLKVQIGFKIESHINAKDFKCLTPNCGYNNTIIWTQTPC